MSFLEKVNSWLVAKRAITYSKIIADIDRQEKYLNSLPEPKDDFERAYYQYKCQRYNNTILYNILVDFGSLVLLPVYLVMFVLKGRKTTAEKTIVDAVYINNGIGTEIIPSSLVNEYKNIKSVKMAENMILDKIGLAVLKKIIKRYPFSIQFLFKNLVKIAMYNYEISCSQPRAIITYTEVSFAASILTYYCEKQNIAHLNVMHGNKDFVIRDSFFRFTKFYVWDDYYVKLLKKLRCFPDQFVVEIPAYLTRTRLKLGPVVDFKFYLQIESKESLNRLRRIVDYLTEKGYSTILRPHPRATNCHIYREFFNSWETEEASDKEIYDSIMESKYVVARNSTVLFQAMLCSKQVVIDNVSMPGEYENDLRRGYIMCYKSHLLLSDFVDFYGTKENELLLKEEKKSF